MEERAREPRPRARTEGLVVRELAEEVLVYDLERHKAVCLNRTAALVWGRCDGRTGVAGLTRALGEELQRPVPEEVVWLALEQLGRGRLLCERVKRPADAGAMTRRELMRRLGLAAAFALPVVTAIVAPTPAQAASCSPTGGPCTTSAECCGGAPCVGNVCT